MRHPPIQQRTDVDPPMHLVLDPLVIDFAFETEIASEVEVMPDGILLAEVVIAPATVGQYPAVIGLQAFDNSHIEIEVKLY